MTSLISQNAPHQQKCGSERSDAWFSEEELCVILVAFEGIHSQSCLEVFVSQLITKGVVLYKGSLLCTKTMQMHRCDRGNKHQETG